MPTDVEKFVPKKTRHKPSPGGEAEHQGRVKQPGVPSGPRTDHHPNKEAEHQGRVPQPGVPSGPRNTPKVKAKVRRERHNRAVAKSLAPPKIPKAKSANQLAAETPGLTKIKEAQAIRQSESGLDATDVAKFAADEAKSIWKAAQESQREQGHSLADYKGPSRNQAEAALTLGSLIPIADAGKAAETAAKVVSAASDANTAAKAGAKVVAKLKGAPKAAAKDLREYPKTKVRAIKSAPRRAKETVRRAPELKTAAGQKAAGKATARKAAQHPLRTGVGTAAVSPVPLPGELDKRARAFVTGTKNAVVNDPVQTLETTGKGALGFLTAPLAVAGAGVKSVETGSTKPLVKVGKTLGEGTLKMAENLASGKPKLVEQTTLKETGLTPFIPVPHALKLARESKTAEELRGAIRGKVEGKRSATREKLIAAEKARAEEGIAGRKIQKRKPGPKVVGRRVQVRRALHEKPIKDRVEVGKTGQSYVLRRTGRLIEKQHGRHRISREAARIQETGDYAAKRTALDLIKTMRKSPGTNHSHENDGDALYHLTTFGLPVDKAALPHVEELLRKYGPDVPGAHPSNVELARHAAQYILDNPKMFEGKRGKALVEAVEKFDKQAKVVGYSPRAQFVAQTEHVLNPILKKKGEDPILLPEEMIEAKTKALLPKRRSGGAVKVVDVHPRRARREGGPLEQFRGVSDGRIPFEFNEKTGELRLGQRGYTHAEMGWERTAGDPNWRQGEVNLADPARPVFGFGGKVLSRSQRAALSALREHTGLDIRTLDQWHGGQTPKALKSAPGGAKEWSRVEAWDYLKAQREAGHRKEARAIEDSMAGLMKPPEHGGAEHGIATTRAEAYTPEMEARYVARARQIGQREGFREPSAYVAQKTPTGFKGEDKVPDFAAGIPIRKVWPTRGIAAGSGNAAASFESLLQHSISAPRTRAALVTGLNRIFDHASREVTGKRYLQLSEVEHAINTHQVPDGTTFVRTEALRSLLENENHLSPEAFNRALEGAIEEGQKLSAGEQLSHEMLVAKEANLKGDKFAPVNAVEMGELMAQMKPIEGAAKWAGRSTNFATRTILNSPAFALIQIPQEGLPLAAALAKNIVNVPRALANLRQMSKVYTPEEMATVKAVYGSSVGVLGAPSKRALSSDNYLNPIRAAGGTPAWRHAWNLVNGNTLGSFDRGRAGSFRQVAAMAKVEGDFKAAARGLDAGFGTWRKGANNLFKDQQAAVDAMKGMDYTQRQLYVAEHPQLGDKLMVDLNNMAGNWNSFTAFEKHLAPLTIFYPFQRYSVLWMLYHFPLDHPVVATALALMGQVNAQELERLAAKKGGTPAVLDYTMPVIPGVDGEESTVLPAGVRTFPGLSTVQQAAVSGKPTQLLGELTPAVQIPVESITDTNAYTGQSLGENGWLHLVTGSASLSPLARFLGLPTLGKEPSGLGAAFEEQDPLRKYRSTIDPFIGQTANQYGEVKKIEADIKGKYDKGVKIPGPFDSPAVQEVLFAHPDGHVDPKALEDLIARIHLSEEASARLKKREEPTYGPSKSFTKQQSEALKAIEDAYQTTPQGLRAARKKEEEEHPFGALPGSKKFNEEHGFASPSELLEEYEFGK